MLFFLFLSLSLWPAPETPPKKSPKKRPGPPTSTSPSTTGHSSGPPQTAQPSTPPRARQAMQKRPRALDQALQVAIAALGFEASDRRGTDTPPKAFIVPDELESLRDYRPRAYKSSCVAVMSCQCQHSPET